MPVAINLAKYAGPEARYCPAGVSEFVKNEANSDRLQRNAQTGVPGRWRSLSGFIFSLIRITWR